MLIHIFEKIHDILHGEKNMTFMGNVIPYYILTNNMNIYININTTLSKDASYTKLIISRGVELELFVFFLVCVLIFYDEYELFV